MSNLARNTLVFSGLTMVSRLTGLLRLVAFTYAIGVQRSLADAYNLANVIPNILYEFVVGGLLSALFLPLLVREQESKGKNSSEAWAVANLLLGTVGVVLAIASVFAMAAAPYIVSGLTFLGKGISPERHAEATMFLRFFAPQMFFYGLNALFMAILNSHNIFAITAAAPIINNLVAIATLVAFRFGWVGATGLAIGTTAGIAAMALVQLPWLVKIRMPVRPRVNFRNPVFRSATMLGIPIVAVAIANLAGTAVRTNLLSTVLGGFTAFTICFQLIMMPYGIFAVAIATVLYPALSRAAVDSTQQGFGRTLVTGFNWTSYMMFPVAVGLAAVALPLTRVLFEHRGGEFRYSDSVFTADFLRVYALSILPYSLVMFATRGFYALKDTKTPALINILGVVVNAGISYYLLRLMSIRGVALAAVITYGLTTLLSLQFLRRHFQGGEFGQLLKSFLRIAAATAVMAFAVESAARFTQPNVVVLARGSRLPIRVPASAASGGSVLVTGTADWEALRRHLDLETTAVPRLDFPRESVVLVFGPQSASTTSLEIRQSQVTSSSLTAKLHVRRREGTPAADLPTSPSYLLLKVKGMVGQVHQSMEVQPWKRGASGFFSGEVLRLVMLVLLGGFVYLVTSIVLGAREPMSIVTRLRNRRSAPPPAD